MKALKLVKDDLVNGHEAFHERKIKRKAVE